MKTLPALLLVLTVIYARKISSKEGIYELCAQYFDRDYTFPANIQGYRRRYDRYLQKHKKGQSYSENEKECRLRVFAHNLGSMEKMRGKHRRARFGENKFADWTEAEIKRMFKGTKKPQRPSRFPALLKSSLGFSTAPSFVDWVAAGKVTPVKNQGSCGSCWAFATTAAIESAYLVKRSMNISLAEQQLVDCDRGNNYGCDGGHYFYAYDYATNTGLSTEENYPYTAKNTAYCPATNDQKHYINGKRWLNSETEAKDWIALNGPVAVAIYPVPAAFMYLWTDADKAAAGEVFIPEGNCMQNVIDGGHAITVVGYGTENGTDYWLIKNSWGTDWGDNGYYKFIRGINACEIENFMIAPVLN